MRRIPAFQIPPPRFFQAATPDAAEANQNIPAIPAETSAPPGQAPTPQPAGFNQNRLQMLLITSETLDAKKVAELIAELPDVSGCLLHAGGATYRAGKVPEELEVEFFEQRALEWLGTMQALKLGTMRAFTAHGTELAATLFANVRTCLCVFHDDYGLLPGYVEKLDAVVAEVARMIAEK
jgi:hypothetical protein